jgi:FkbM family methyltransferase
MRSILRGALRAARSLVLGRRARTLLRGIARRIVPGDARALGVDEIAITAEVLGYRNQRGVMIDVGAHYGGSLGRFANAGWRVFAFEPDPKNREQLQSAFGNLSNVTIDPRGVSDTDAAGVPFFTSEVSTGISGLSAFHASHTSSGTVETTTLRRFCSEARVHNVDFLKIDTEGWDLAVLRGFPWDLMRPRAIVCEFEDSKTLPLGYTWQDLARFLVEKGYRLVVSEWHPIREYGTLHDWRRFAVYPTELKDSRGWGNLIAVDTNASFDALVAECKRVGPLDFGQ